MKEALIKYFNNEFKEVGVEFIDFEKLYPIETVYGLMFEGKPIGETDIGFRINTDEIYGTFIINKIDYFIQMGIPFRRNVEVDIETHMPLNMNSKMTSGSAVFQFDVTLNIKHIPENLLASLIGISKFNL